MTNNDENVRPSQEIISPNATSEIPPLTRLENGYADLNLVLRQCEKLIPSVLEEFSIEHFGKRLPRKKQFTATGIKQIRQSLQANFSDPEEQYSIVDSTRGFLKQIMRMGIDPRVEETTPFGKLDRFLSEFPGTILDVLGDNVDAKTVTTIIGIGRKKAEEELQKHDSREYLPGDQDLLNHNLAKCIKLVGETIPKALNASGSDRHITLVRIQKAAETLTTAELEDFVEYIIKRKPLSEYMKGRLAQFTSFMDTLSSEKVTENSPLNRDDREQWRNLREMGKETRTPTWRDLGDIIRAGEEDSREYGISIGMHSGGNQPPVLDFLRGAADNIINGPISPSEKQLAFHSHPSRDTHEFTAPVVSPSDMGAQSMSDYGGGYLNVAYLNGVTLHIGGEIVGPDNRVSRGDKNYGKYIYKVESGMLAGTLMIPLASFQDTVAVMKDLYQTGKPYLYSILDTLENVNYYFVALPWKDVDASIPLEDLCFKDGLPRLVGQIEDLPKNIHVASNLREAMDTSRALVHQSIAIEYEKEE